jgi:single-strand DNA-binding protein
MASLNKVLLIGNAGKDADLRYTANGVATATFSLAVNHRRRGHSGEWEDQTEWFNIVLFAETAEKLSQYILKGKPLYVEGRFQTRTWDNDQGVKQYRTEVIANQIQLLGSKDDDGQQAARPAATTTRSNRSQRNPEQSFEDFLDEGWKD